MHIDYTEMFSSPEDLANFCMLSNEEQQRIDTEFAATSNKFEMACDLSKRNHS